MDSAASIEGYILHGKLLAMTQAHDGRLILHRNLHHRGLHLDLFTEAFQVPPTIPIS